MTTLLVILAAFYAGGAVATFNLMHFTSEVVTDAGTLRPSYRDIFKIALLWPFGPRVL